MFFVKHVTSINIIMNLGSLNTEDQLHNRDSPKTKEFFAFPGLTLLGRFSYDKILQTKGTCTIH